MKKAKVRTEEMRTEYGREDLGQLVRSKYAAAYAKSTNVVVIDPGLTKSFPNSEVVNEALRSFLAVATLTTGITLPGQNLHRESTSQLNPNVKFTQLPTPVNLRATLEI